MFGFRGGDPAALLADDSPSVRLTVSRRCAPLSLLPSPRSRVGFPAATARSAGRVPIQVR
ncbi:hypothetical protein I553_0144 [Mycobacterium xenopi 4042]|uniref:Uncharacterized protein n=1 Tax=Mycobacterium xenopi 4042 TaxID=1299334 RepID=X7YKR8_MYCXE|nr:hypothetical protein I553_0144 [Mycobacterium xenopi 4042]